MLGAVIFQVATLAVQLTISSDGAWGKLVVCTDSKLMVYTWSELSGEFGISFMLLNLPLVVAVLARQGLV
jgi:hypothetical protein